MNWTIKYVEKEKEYSLVVAGTTKDVETALNVIKGKHGTVISLESSDGRKYYKVGA